MKKIVFILIAITYAAGAQWSEPRLCGELNSEADEFAPYWDRFRNILIFNSTRKGDSKYFFASIDSSGIFSHAEFLNSPLNKSGGNLSYFTLIDKDNAFISKFEAHGRRSHLNLYKSIFIKGGWTEAFVDTNFSDASFNSHPSISENGKIMVFASNRSHSGSRQQDSDLWMAYRISQDQWGSFTRLDNLNSHDNEISPSFKGNDTLFFASNGLGGAGGYDLYFTVLSEGKWEKPRPFLFNTEFDESDPVAFGDFFVFASNRPGGDGGLDLYISKKLEVAEPSENRNITKLNLLLQTTSIKLAIFRESEYNYPQRYLPIHMLTKNTSAPNANESILRKNFTLTLDKLSKTDNGDIVVNPSDIETATQFDNIGILTSSEVPRGLVEVKAGAEFFLPKGISKDSISILPPVLDLRIENGSEHAASSNLKLFIARSDAERQLVYDDTLTTRAFIDLREHSGIFPDLDEIEIIAEKYESEELVAEGSIVAGLSKSISERKAFSRDQDRYLDVYETVLINANDLSAPYIIPMVKSIAESVQNSNSFIIEYSNADYLGIASKLGDLILSLTPQNPDKRRIGEAKTMLNRKLSASSESGLSKSEPDKAEYCIIRIEIEKFRRSD